MTLGKRIKDLREQNGLSQKELAEILRIQNSTLSQYESDTRTPSDDIKKAIADYFNVTLDFLMGRDIKATDGTSQPIELEGMYFHLAKEAQEMGLEQEDIDYILDFYRRHKEKNAAFKNGKKDK